MGESWSTHLVSEWFLCNVGGAQVAPDWLCVSCFKGMVGLCVVGCCAWKVWLSTLACPDLHGVPHDLFLMYSYC